jgi:nucleoside-diphosphate-sugar epimerase
VASTSERRKPVWILIAGAGDTIGRPLVDALVAEGHDVSGLTRATKSAARVAEDGARPLVTDALNREQLARATWAAANHTGY